MPIWEFRCRVKSGHAGKACSIHYGEMARQLKANGHSELHYADNRITEERAYPRTKLLWGIAKKNGFWLIHAFLDFLIVHSSPGGVIEPSFVLFIVTYAWLNNRDFQMPAQHFKRGRDCVDLRRMAEIDEPVDVLRARIKSARQL